MRPTAAGTLRWLWVAAIVALVGANVLFLLGSVAVSSVQRDHHRWLARVHLGMTEQEVLAVVGKPNSTFTFAEAEQQNYDWFGDGSEPGYYHRWQGIGQLPLEFDHAAKYLHSIAWGDYLFYDRTGHVICILSGSS